MTAATTDPAASCGEHGETIERSKARPITIVVRPEVAAFAQLREAKLAQNDHKPSWRRCTPEWLLDRLEEEVGELRQAIFWDKDPQHIAEEAADVGNFAMFIADVVGGLVLDTESVGSTIELNKNMSTTKDSETDMPLWRCPRCKDISILEDFHFCPSCGRRIEWVDFGLDGPKELEKTEPADPFAEANDRHRILWIAHNLDEWKRLKKFKPGRLMTRDEREEFETWLAAKVMGGDES